MEKREMVYMFEIHGVERKTDKAVLVRIDHETFWLPRNKVMIGKPKSGREDHMKMAVDVKDKWLLENNGLLKQAQNGNSIYNYIITEKPVRKEKQQ